MVRRPRHTEITNARGLSPRERETVLQWVKGGKLKGDLTKLSSVAPKEESAWRIGKPDLVLEAPCENLPADGIVEYKYILLPHVFTHDTWVSGVQIVSDNPKALHHCNLAYLKLGEKFRMSNFITGTVPGGTPMDLSDGVAVLIPRAPCWCSRPIT